jgi:DNA invertase Pin-like site-specific DNA recombinase
MSKLGYIRVSSTDQNPDRQRDALQALGVDRVFEDKRSGKDTARPALQKLMEYARDGDVIYFESISRLARNTRDFLDLMELFTSKGVAVVSQKEPIDTTTPAGKLICTIFAALAEMERSSIKDRQREGIQAAQRRGKQFGRPRVEKPPGWDDAISKWRAGTVTAADTWRSLRLTKATFYKLVKGE